MPDKNTTCYCMAILSLKSIYHSLGQESVMLHSSILICFGRKIQVVDNCIILLPILLLIIFFSTVTFISVNLF